MYSYYPVCGLYLRIHPAPRRAFRPRACLGCNVSELIEQRQGVSMPPTHVGRDVVIAVARETPRLGIFVEGRP
jgi:hypothetical protein